MLTSGTSPAMSNNGLLNANSARLANRVSTAALVLGVVFTAAAGPNSGDNEISAAGLLDAAPHGVVTTDGSHATEGAAPAWGAMANNTAPGAARMIPALPTAAPANKGRGGLAARRCLALRPRLSGAGVAGVGASRGVGPVIAIPVLTSERTLAASIIGPLVL